MSTIGSVDQILRVNHAGEKGAISIYRAQIAVAKLLVRDCVAPLTEMLAHERTHFGLFDELLRRRQIRHCYALPLWALGGLALGALTALLGRRAIWSCTAAIESTVNAHLEHQVAFLESTDQEVLAAVETIRADERAHEYHARESGGEAGGVYRAVRAAIMGATSFAIWLSSRL